ncbi:MAG: flagellin [Chitinispirillaceae bacterium]
MLSGLNFTTMRLVNTYNTSQSSLANSLERISSGIKLRQPKDGISDFMKVESLRQDRVGYNSVNKSLRRASGMLDIAQTAGDMITQNLRRMKELTTIYWEDGTTGEEQKALEAEYNALKEDIDRIVNTSHYEGQALIQNTTTLESIALDPNDTQNTLDISFSGITLVDTSVLDITGGADNTRETAMELVETEYGHSLDYLAKTTGFIHSVESQRKLNESSIENNSAYESTLNDINDAEEMSRMINSEIRQQASLSMILQANMSRMSVVQLLG